MNENLQRETPSQDEFRAKAAEFRQLAQRAKDPTMAEVYRKLAEEYEIWPAIPTRLASGRRGRTDTL
jgi:hypothetical protein